MPSENPINKLFFHFYQTYNKGFSKDLFFNSFYFLFLFDWLFVLFLEIYFETNEEKLKFIIWESQVAEQCVADEERQAEESIEFKVDRNYKKYFFNLLPKAYLEKKFRALCLIGNSLG